MRFVYVMIRGSKICHEDKLESLEREEDDEEIDRMK